MADKLHQKKKRITKLHHKTIVMADKLRITEKSASYLTEKKTDK